MGENEQGELIHYTIFLMMMLVLNTLLIGFMQFTQVQTVQHNIESTLSKNGGYTHDAIKQITGSENAANSNRSLIPITNWIYLDRDVAQNADKWSDYNNGDPKNSAGNTEHWNLSNGTVENQNTVVPYRVVVKPFGSDGGKSSLIFGWIPEVSFNGSAQSQVYTGTVS